MKKSFLKAFIVISIFSIFSCGVFSISQAQRITSEEQARLDFKKNLQTEPTFSEKFGSAWRSIPTAAKEAVANPIVAGMSGFITTILAGFAWFAVQLSSLVLFLAGGIFDFVIDKTVLNNTILETLNEAIRVGWKIVRDVLNMVVVFSLLYLGIKTILQGEGFADKKVLIGIIIAAIFINFSLLFTKSVFEVSNFVSKGIGEQIKFQGDSRGDVSTISGGLVKMVKPQNLLNYIYTPTTDIKEVFNKYQVALFTVLTMLILAIILFSASFLIISRFAIFILLMITSPLGLVSKFIPWLNGYGQMWWEALKKQAIVLPVFFLSLYISIYFVSTLSGGLTSPNFIIPQGASSSVIESMATGLVQFIVYFALIIIALIIPLWVPGKIGAAGSGMMTSAANWTKNKIRTLPQRSAGMAAGGVARSGRYLIGDKLSGRLVGKTPEDRKKLQEIARGSDLKAVVARQRLKTAESLKDKTFDVRNTKTVQNSGFGKGMGTAIDSYNGAIKKKTAAYEEQKKKEFKTFGYDKLHESAENQIAIRDAEKLRDEREKKYKDAQDEFKKNASKENFEKMNSAKKSLEGIQETIGRFKNLGEVKFMESYQNRFFQKLDQKISNTTKLANKKIAEEQKKRWASAGESSKSRKLRADMARIESTLTPPENKK